MKHGIATDKARTLPDGLEIAIGKMAKRVYRSLEISGYARIDMRLDDTGKVYVLEANPNPQIAYGEDFAESARRAGVSLSGMKSRVQRGRQQLRTVVEACCRITKNPSRRAIPKRNSVVQKLRSAIQRSFAATNSKTWSSSDRSCA